VSAGALEITLITDRQRARGRLVDIVREAGAAGVDYVQVREKDLGSQALLALVRTLRAAIGTGATRLLVNGRPDIAIAAGADGVQLAEAGLDVAAVRAAFPGLRIGASCHSSEAATRAERAGADFVVFGPVFATPGKEERAVGLAALAAVVERVNIPVHAVGGIDASHAASVRESGARGIAAIRLFTDAPEGRLAELLRRVRTEGAPERGRV
jgi:thiamine-phosphate pyrophosphorylase